MTRIQVLLAATAAAFGLSAAPEWEDHTKLSYGKEAPRAAFASFPSVEEAKAIRPKHSSRYVLLDSEKDWRFSYCERPEDRPVGFQDPDYDVSSWDVVKVPCSWQAMGINSRNKPYGHPYYTNAHWPFVAKFPANSNSWPRVRGLYKPEGYTMKDDENPVGSYRRDFVLPEDWQGDEIFIEFGAVDSFFYLWVNGRYVGFSKSNRDPATFNITKFAKPGKNVLALEVYRFCDGSYLEAQDMLLLSGLARSVWLYHVPKTHVRDVYFTTSPLEKRRYDGDWKLDLALKMAGEDARSFGVKVFDVDGNEVGYSGSVDAKSAKGTLVFRKPDLWSAETPNLYTLVIEHKNASGATAEALGFQLGFREVEIRDAARQCDRTFLVNGQPVKLRGANRHETSPVYGHYTPDELIELDVKQLKQANCNHVRNAHYPQPDYFYYLCNKYGIYVMDEANIESHGFFYGKESISHVKSWEPAHVDRILNMVERNKCHPSIVIWSLGNEAGPGDVFKACTTAIRQCDPSRPVQYERNNWLADMGARQYPTVQWMWDCANAKEGMSHVFKDQPLRYPFHVNEYAHNMGNAMGNLKDYQDAIESTTRICGAAIWDWVDQGIYHVTSNGVRIIAYGGDWGDYPNAGAFVMNGCVLADRTPEPGYWEVKHVFQPIVCEKGADGKSIKVFNRHYFRDLSAYECRVTHMVDGKAVARFTSEVAAAARQSATIPVADATGSYRVEFVQRETEGHWPKGWTIADDQIDFTMPKPACAQSASGRLEFGFDEKTGELVSLKSGRFFKTELLREPLTLDIFRAPSQNEPNDGKRWLDVGAMNPARKLVSFSDVSGDVMRMVVSVVDYAVSGAVFTVTSKWTIMDGAAKLKVSIRRTGKEIEPARVGLRTMLAKESLDVEWLGCGPFENYSDRKSGAFLGLWRLASDDFFFPYDVPQDCGNREGTFRVKLASAFDSLTVETLAKPFAFEVCPYAPETLVQYRHPAELPAGKGTFFGVYAQSRGLGGNSCGPKPLARDCVLGEEFVLELVIR